MKYFYPTLFLMCSLFSGFMVLEAYLYSPDKGFRFLSIFFFCISVIFLFISYKSEDK